MTKEMIQGLPDFFRMVISEFTSGQASDVWLAIASLVLGCTLVPMFVFVLVFLVIRGPYSARRQTVGIVERVDTVSRGQVEVSDSLAPEGSNWTRPVWSSFQYGYIPYVRYTWEGQTYLARSRQTYLKDTPFPGDEVLVLVHPKNKNEVKIVRIVKTREDCTLLTLPMPKARGFTAALGKAIKSFKVLKASGKKIGLGGIICMTDTVFPIDSENVTIPCNII